MDGADEIARTSLQRIGLIEKRIKYDGIYVRGLDLKLYYTLTTGARYD